MKYAFIFLLNFIFLLSLTAQEKSSFLRGVQIDLGYIYMSNSLNNNDYYNFKYNGAPIKDETSMSGINLKFTLQTKNEYVDLIFGSMVLVGNDDLGSKSWSPGDTNSFDYSLNGGGVYLGVSPKIKGKTVGLTSDFAIGVFSFKEYLGIFNNTQEPYVDEYEKNSTGGLGAISSIGGYVKLGKLGINPSVNVIYSGSSSASFIFYGFVLPVTYQF